MILQAKGRPAAAEKLCVAARDLTGHAMRELEGTAFTYWAAAAGDQGPTRHPDITRGAVMRIWTLGCVLALAGSQSQTLMPGGPLMARTLTSKRLRDRATSAVE
jgi:hypothetical protein